MKKTILALALIGIAGTTAVQAREPLLSEIPAGAIHTPGIGPGYIFPDTAVATAPDDMSQTSSMLPGMAMPSLTDTGLPESMARQRIRAQGYTNVQNLRQDETGAWQGIANVRGMTQTVSVSTQGVVTVTQ